MTVPSDSSFSAKTRANLAAILNHALREELLLSNVTRMLYARFPTFHCLHKLFADQYRQLDGWLARLAQFASVAPPTPARDDGTQLGPVVAGDLNSERSVIAKLLSRHEELANELEADVRACAQQRGDPAMAELLKRLVEFHETTAWMLRMVLEGASTPPHVR
jgi:DNA-binding ferritin-like protein